MNNRRLRPNIRCAALSILAMLGGLSFFGPPTKARDQDIVFSYLPSSEGKGKGKGKGKEMPTNLQKNLWPKICKNLQITSTKGLGGLGRGPFDVKTCAPFGTSQKPTEADHKPYYLMALDLSSKTSHIALSYVQGQTITLISQSEAFPLTEKFLKKLADDPKAARILMETMMVQSPCTSQLIIKGKNPSYPIAEPKHIAANYYVTELDWDQGMIKPTVIGNLKLKKAGPKKARFRFSAQKNRKPKGQRLCLVPNSAERQRLVTQVEEDASAYLKDFMLLDLLHDTLGLIGHSQVTLRYGLPLFPEDSIVSKATMFAMSLEMRDGPLDGLRWYWEIAPNTASPSVLEPSIIESITYSRAAFGWALSLGLPEFLSVLFDRMDIIPKIGLLDVDGRFAVDDSFDGYERSSFIVKNVIDLGLEVGVEYPAGDFDLRLMGAANWAHSSLSLTKSNANFFSYRSSLELFYTVGDILGFNVRIAGFGSVERLNLVQNISAEDRVNQTAIREIGFNLFFLGAGGSIAW